MENSKPTKTPTDTDSKLTKGKEGEPMVGSEKYQAIVGSMLYLSTRTRPDLAFAEGMVARFCDYLTTRHWTALKRILRYLRGTQDMGLSYQKEKEGVCVGYSDADWVGSPDDRKSTSGYGESQR